MGALNTYIDPTGTKRCKHLGRKYPEECNDCPHYVPIYCGCDYEFDSGEGLGTEVEDMIIRNTQKKKQRRFREVTKYKSRGKWKP